MNHCILIVSAFLFLANPYLKGQTSPATASKQTVYGEFGLGFGQTLFFGDMDAKLINSYGGTFSPGIGNNLSMGFYVAPPNWRGLGIGSRIKGTFGTPVEGDNGDDYIFNYYNLAASIKYYGLSKQFNRGLYTRGSIGFGQFTTKRQNEDEQLYKHQYAIGLSYMGGIGYTLPARRTAVSFELEFEYANRNGTIDGMGEQNFQSGQIGGNLTISF
ncbi:MAG: hypothetical protein WBA17_03730 [Saprospiraceae bacterium]